MPRANEAFQTSGPMYGKLPTIQYPYLKKLIFELDFACSTCSSAKGQPTYRTVAEVLSAGMGDPINGPGKYFTRYVLKCPECLTIPEEGPFIMHGIIDLLSIPAGYKRPDRGAGSADNNLFEDEGEDANASVLRQPEEPSIALPKARSRGPVKKVSELHPKTTGRKVKAKGLSTLRAGLKRKVKAARGEDLDFAAAQRK
jgi:hypothetical protein